MRRNQPPVQAVLAADPTPADLLAPAGSDAADRLAGLLAPARSAPPRPRARRAALAAALCALLFLVVSGASRPAHAAEVADQPGQAVGVAIQSALWACSAVSIGGNAANIAMKNPQRGWMYSGFICGFVNTLISPIILIYFQDPPPYGVTAGFVHGALGITNLGLAIYNGVLWHRAHTAAKEPPRLALQPFIGRDSIGASVAGLSLSLSRF